MANLNRPGVYVNELPLAAGPINTVSAAVSAGAVIAALPQGPDTVTRVTSWASFKKLYGGYNKSYPATFAIGQFFENGGSDLYVKRAIPFSSLQKAKLTVASTATNVTTVTKSITKVALTSNVATITVGTHGFHTNDVVVISGLTGDNAFLNVTATITGTTSTTFTFAATHADVAETTVSAGTVVRTTGSIGNLLTLAAKNRGIDGNNIRVEFTQSRSVHLANYFDMSVYVEAGVNDYVSSSFTPANAVDDLLVEQFNGIVFDDPMSGDYITTVLQFGSAYVEVLEGVVTEFNSAGEPVTTTYTVDNTAERIPTAGIKPLTGATNPEVPLTYGDYTGDFTVVSGGSITGAAPSSPDIADAAVYTEFEVIDQPLVFFLPDVITQLGSWSAAKPVYDTLIQWAETNRHFVIVETAAGQTADGALDVANDLTESSRAAVYYPHIYIKDPLGRSTGTSVRKIGPSGAVAGLYMSTDAKIGPFKTPAGIDAKLVGAIALERAFTPTELDALNSGINSGGTLKNAVNAIRNLPGAGIVVMGGRTLKQDGTANRYVSMRRSLIYIEKRLNDIAQFAVFENNSEVLWARLTAALGSFLNEYRNQGGLRGTTIADSFYVKIDGENNTTASIQAGEVHIEIGVALEYPAEFVVINLSQKTAQ